MKVIRYEEKLKVKGEKVREGNMDSSQEDERVDEVVKKTQNKLKVCGCCRWDS